MGGIALSEYRQDGHALSAQEFILRHGSGFLVHHGALGQSGAGLTQTLDTDSAKTVADRPGFMSERFVVYPLLGNPQEGSGSKLLMVGRMATNEVVIDEATVSQVHALIRFEPSGGFSLQDAGSRNGTFVNGRQVPKQGDGQPVALKAGSRVSLGGSNFTFLDGGTFYRFVNSLFRF